MIHLEWYRIFLHAAKAGNLTKAAGELYITQPSVSYAIKQMEQALSMKLFHRQSKGVELTTEGKQLLLYVEQSFALLEAGEKKMSALKHLTGGELRVGASDSLFKHILFPYLDTYHKQYPDVRIRLSHGKTFEITARVKEGMSASVFLTAKHSRLQLESKRAASISGLFICQLPMILISMSKRS
ncbi:LysR family transcriptional regulator [Paenibacillus sp. TAF58]